MGASLIVKYHDLLMPFYLFGDTGTCREASVGLKAFVFKLLNCVEHIVIWGAWLGRHTC